MRIMSSSTTFSALYREILFIWMFSLSSKIFICDSFIIPYLLPPPSASSVTNLIKYNRIHITPLLDISVPCDFKHLRMLNRPETTSEATESTTMENMTMSEESISSSIADGVSSKDSNEKTNVNVTTIATLSIDEIANELRQVKIDFDNSMLITKTVADAEMIRREVLGKKGPVQRAMNSMKLLSNDDKPKLGAVVNEIKNQLDHSMQQRKEFLIQNELEEAMENDRIDVTMPGTTRMVDVGRRHPLSMTMEKAIDIFVSLGYDTVTGCDVSPEIETDYYCFTALNSPKDHPARDMQDTFYLTDDMEYMLRTHTSSVQIRHLENNKPPFRIVAPGRVYRKDDIDATHSLMFHQMEILAIEPKGELTLGHLKGTVEYFLKQMLGSEIKIRFRGSYFPFTEPSMEVDVYFNNKWMEVLGCGMVDPNVLSMAGIDPNKYSGFAAGFGIERFTMVIHQINDLRLFFNNDKRFLQQFPYFYDDGVISFLTDGITREDQVDIRGNTVPDPPVDNLEELRERLAKSDATVSIPNDVIIQSTRNNVSEIEIIPQTGDSIDFSKNLTLEHEIVAKDGNLDGIDISKLDIRVGMISKIWEHPNADKLFCEEIDVGEDQPRLIASGLRLHYTTEQLLNQRVLVLCNLKPRKMLGFSSHGMILCASSNDQVQLIQPSADAIIGERINVEGYDGEPATENQILKKKMLDIIIPHLQSDSNGMPCYKGIPLKTATGICQLSMPNCPIS